MADVPENSNYHDDVSSQARRWVSVTPHDSTNLSELPKALWVGGAGNIALVGSDDAAVTFSGVAAGTVIPCRPKRVNATNTTATLIVALY